MYRVKERKTGGCADARAIKGIQMLEEKILTVEDVFVVFELRTMAVQSL